MQFLLDTCALSELVARKPNRDAQEAIVNLPDEAWCMSAMTVGELRRGIDEMDAGKRREFLEAWFSDHILGIYFSKIVPFDWEAAKIWGSMYADLLNRRLPMQVEDSIIAATAMTHGLTVVTRNESDFIHCGVPIFNPWK